MSELWTTLVVGAAGPLGAVLILAAAIVAAAALAERIDPTPPVPVESRVREATERRRWHEQVDAQVRGAEQARGREPVDSTHVSFPAFGIAFLAWLLLSAWGAAAEHVERPGEGFPFALAVRPLWVALVGALLVGITAGFFYRRWYHRQSWQRKAAIRSRREAEERHDFQARLRAIRLAGHRQRRKSS
ncbi:hypothetical protein K3N28_14225 [Glycomyces sp. TRM65418]|uniref:hypothetical protein n=1 Tax=Glycomyces sp. TRM65418 TaxID=2867006 RepID=UPI001CE4D657|nr:hypothetical protein [Glycomyces sp. TRM65418]MCC3764221.1 hypothetical protein [Glycomyces sp. TRM65418]QZD53904.1 hypothetical protein K3N28_14160 [Glycomyces sp. TRM65418]